MQSRSVWHPASLSNPMRNCTLFLVNGTATSAAGERARRISKELGASRRVMMMYREGGRAADIGRFARAALAGNYDSIYVMELAVVPVLSAAVGYRGAAVLVDTGDSPAKFLELIGANRAKIIAARALEDTAYGNAREIIVRGQYHKAALQDRGYRHVSVVPDGVDLKLFRPISDNSLRHQLVLDKSFTVGIQGHFTWYPSLGGGLGCELVEAIALLRDLPVHAVLIGDGVGLPHLRVLAGRLGVADRLHILGPVPYHALPRYLGLCDVCLLTQTNDASSWVRTTGKLPGYLATGRYILAARVGTAADILPEEMLIDYHGHWDRTYPSRLASRIAEVMEDSERTDKGLDLRVLAEPFEYGNVARLAGEAIRRALAPRD